MPLTAKGETIKAALTKEYGADKGESVLYAGKNAGTFSGIDDDAELDTVSSFLDSYRHDAEDKDPKYNAEAVQKAIEASKRSGRPIGGKEAKLIHALLKGRHDAAECNDSVQAMCDSVGKMRAVCDDHRVIGGVRIPPTAAQIKNTMGLRFDAEDLETYVGKYVTFKRATPSGPTKDRGKVTRVLRGQLEVRAVSGGYYMLDRNEVTVQ